MKEGFVQFERLVNVKGVTGLNEVKQNNGEVHIGALSTHRELESSPILKEKLPALVKLEQNVANVRVRQVGTIGGNLCFAEPHADPGTLLIALGARLVAEKGEHKREITAESFFVDAYETALEPDEVLTQIIIPVPTQPSGVCYMKFGYLERPSVGLAVAVKLNPAKTEIEDIRIAVGCAGPAPKRVAEAEALLKGKSLDEATRNIPQAGETSGRASQAISDLHGAQDYKEHIVQVLLKRSFQSALSQCA
jgi:carbon-monoxide dehydrogenase medium subunit